MNCQETRNLFEEAIDHALTGARKRKFDLHLQRCSSCRALYDAEVREHAELFRAFKDFPAEALPSHSQMVARLVAAQSSTPRPPWYRRLPRWMKFAASFMIVASLTALGSVVVSAIVESADSDHRSASDLACGDQAVPEDPDYRSARALACCDQADPEDSDYRSARVLACGALAMSGIASTPLQTFTNPEEDSTMKPTLAAVALAVGAVAIPTATLQAFENSCIISGSTERTYAHRAYTEELTFDARTHTTMWALAKYSGLILLIK